MSLEVHPLMQGRKAVTSYTLPLPLTLELKRLAAALGHRSASSLVATVLLDFVVKANEAAEARRK